MSGKASAPSTRPADIAKAPWGEQARASPAKVSGRAAGAGRQHSSNRTPYASRPPASPATPSVGADNPNEGIFGLGSKARAGDSGSVTSAHSGRTAASKASVATASMLAQQRELVLRLRALSEENRLAKARWRQAVDDLEAEQASKKALIAKLVPGAAAAYARSEEAERRVKELEQSLQQALDGALTVAPGSSGQSGSREAGPVSTGPGAGAPSSTAPATKSHVRMVRDMVGFASHWSMDTLFPAIRAEWARVAAALALVWPLISVVRVVVSVASAPMLVVPFSLLDPDAWAAVWPLTMASGIRAWVPMAAALALSALYCWAAATSGTRTWVSGPLVLSALTAASVYGILSAWPAVTAMGVGSQLPSGAALFGAGGAFLGVVPGEVGASHPEEAPLRSVIRRSADAWPGSQGAAGWEAAQAVFLRVPAWSSPHVMVCCLGVGPFLVAARILLSPATRRTHGWALKLAIADTVRYLEACAAAFMAVISLTTISCLPFPELASGLLEYNAFRHALLSLLALMSGDAAAHQALNLLRDTVGSALATTHSAVASGAAGPSATAAIGAFTRSRIPDPNFFLNSASSRPLDSSADLSTGWGTLWATMLLYYLPSAVLVWLAVRMWIVRRAEMARAATRPAGLAEHVSAEGDRLAARRAFPSVLAVASVHAALLAWLKLVAEPTVAPEVWGAMSSQPVSVVAAATSPVLLVTSVSLAVLAHRVSRNMAALAEPQPDEAVEDGH